MNILKSKMAKSTALLTMVAFILFGMPVSASFAQSTGSDTTQDSASTETQAAEEAKPAEETQAAEETKPAEETQAAEETKPAEETQAAEETKPAEETQAAEETKPADEKAAAETAAESKPSEPPSFTAGNDPAATAAQAMPQWVWIAAGAGGLLLLALIAGGGGGGGGGKGGGNQCPSDAGCGSGGITW